jgi:pimeloyl-ACP methyl ester carboxylesterase
MGAWIAVHVARARPERVAGILGVGSAPDFTEEMWRQGLDPDRKRELLEKGVTFLPSRYDPNEPYPITWHLIEEARRWLLLNETDRGIPLVCPVHLLHGKLDEDVSFMASVQLSQVLMASARTSKDKSPHPDVRVTLVDDGDHRLSRPQDLRLLATALDRIVRAYNSA